MDAEEKDDCFGAMLGNAAPDKNNVGKVDARI